MGTNIGDIIKTEETSLESLSGRRIAIDAFNTLYQFLSIIRQPDGTPLKDRKGRITSHLSGMFYRNVRLLENGILPVYVYDGESPELKTEEVQRRREIRKDAEKEWKKAKAEGRIEDARKAAQASSRLSSDMIEGSKKLLGALGIPAIQAPSEGEALAAEMAREDIVWASASQDYDSLLYNCPLMIRNLSITGRRKVARSKRYKTIYPEIIDLDMNLKLLEITQSQLIDIGIMAGTDYNDNIPGVGAKTALKLIRKYDDFNSVIKAKNFDIDFPYEQIRDIFLNPPKSSVEELEWTEPDPNAVKALLCNAHDFSISRVDSTLKRLDRALQEMEESGQQSSLTDFF